jgi:hypothetical protein
MATSMPAFAERGRVKDAQEAFTEELNRILSHIEERSVSPAREKTRFTSDFRGCDRLMRMGMYCALYKDHLPGEKRAQFSWALETLTKYGDVNVRIWAMRGLGSMDLEACLEALPFVYNAGDGVETSQTVSHLFSAPYTKITGKILSRLSTYFDLCATDSAFHLSGWRCFLSDLARLATEVGRNEPRTIVLTLLDRAFEWLDCPEKETQLPKETQVCLGKEILPRLARADFTERDAWECRQRLFDLKFPPAPPKRMSEDELQEALCAPLQVGERPWDKVRRDLVAQFEAGLIWRKRRIRG